MAIASVVSNSARPRPLTMKPTIGSIDMEGVIALSGESDTAGLFGREPAKWTRFIKAWYGDFAQ